MGARLICCLSVAALLGLACSDPASTPLKDASAGDASADMGVQPPTGGGPPPPPPPPTCEDRDGDGFQNTRCNANPQQMGGDCDDTNNLVYPGRMENCGNELDNDCNGRVPSRDTACIECGDADGDGFQDATCNPDRTRGGGDCRDDRPDVNPGRGEICGNFLDDDCQGGDVPCLPNCTDQDLDGFGEGSGCYGVDCNDMDARVNPWQVDRCGDNIDQDCSGADLACPTNCTDRDRDGFGEGGGCINTDCDDGDPEVNPGAREIPGDGVDQDCDGRDGALRMNCLDRDGDGYGEGAGCIQTDCDDSNPRIHRDRTEICSNGIDDDCLGGDRPCVQIGEGPCMDADGDGFGPGACAKGTLDCDNNNAAVNPDAPETCDGVDNNCNGDVDECPLQGQVCEGGMCVGGRGAPCRNDNECAGVQGLACAEDARQCRVRDGEICEAGADCMPGAECITLGACDPESQRCYQAKGGECDESCDCTGEWLCHEDNGRCIECFDDLHCGADDRTACTDGGYCAEPLTLGGADEDVRYAFFRRLVACWNAFGEDNEVHACDQITFEAPFMVGGAAAESFGNEETEYNNGSPCDDAALTAAGFSRDDIDVLDELFGGCADLNLNRINVFWEAAVRPGSTWCLYYAPEKSGFGFPQDSRVALVVDSCGLSVIE